MARTIVHIDPHPVFRDGLEAVCRKTSDLAFVCGVGTAGDGLAAIDEHAPDLAVIDVDLPDMPGLALLRAATKAAPGTRYVALTGARDGASIYGMFAAGACGYLTKDASGPTLCEALRAAAAGDTVISPELHRLVAAEIRLHAAAAEVRLTPREREVLTLVAQGCTTPEIGRRLYVSHTTVKSHLANVYEKLGVSHRAAAVAQAIRRGLVDVAAADPL